MFRSKQLIRETVFKFFIILVLCLTLSNSSFAQRATIDQQREEAFELISQNRYIDALPILEKIVLSYPDDAELWAQFGIAIVSYSVTIESAEERKKEYERGVKALLRARQLGTDNIRALDLLDQFSSTDGEDNFSSENPEVEKALREGEAFFGRGDYDNAFAAYEKAYKIDPKSYEAVLFMGDSRYAQKRYAESEPYFAKAAAIDPNREMAFRFWGDALMNQQKFTEARDKFVEALIAAPYSRMTWNSLREWSAAAEKYFSPYEIIPPGNGVGGVIEIDEKSLKSDDGTMHWKIYKDALAAKSSPTFPEEIAAWRKVADAGRKDLRAGKIKYPDQNLVNLVRIDDEGFLETYVLIMRPRPTFGEDYADYREKNREKIRNFIIKYFLKAEK